MNLRVGINLGLAVFWLVVGVYLLIAYPDRGIPLGDTIVSLGWFAILFVLWNLVRVPLFWTPRENQEGRE